MKESITDLSYAAIEPVFNRIRLAHDGNGDVYILGSPDFQCSAPYSVALTGTLYDEFMHEHTLNEVEFRWVNDIKGFVRQLCMVD